MSQNHFTTLDRPSPTFWMIWTGQIFSLLGSQLVQFALVWWLTKTTGSATVLAMGTLVAMLPQVFLSPFAGALIDRWDRRLVMIFADGAIALTTLATAGLFLLGLAQPWHIYVLMFIRSAGAAFHWPAMQASTSLMVPEAHLSRIAGLNQALNGGANIIAPPLGALLLELLPMQGVLSIDVITALIAILPLLFVRIPRPTQAASAGASSVWADVREGFRYVFSWSGAIFLLCVAMIINLLFIPADSLLPILITRRFHGEAAQFALIQSAFGFGIVAGGITLGVWGGFKRRIYTHLLALVLMGVGMLVVGLAPANGFAVAVAGMFFTGFMLPIVNGVIFAIAQSTVPPEMQGRFFTVAMSGSAAMSPLGLIIAGPFSDAVGVHVWFIMAGLVVALVAAIGFFVPAVIHIEEGPKGQAGQAPTPAVALETLPVRVD